MLLVNLGTPQAPTPRAVRRYLGEFLWDPRVVEAPRWLWWLILHAVILRIRPARSARAYQTIWSAEGSPLLAHARAQAQSLARRLDDLEPGLFRVALAMRYGEPALPAVVADLLDDGVDRLLVLPLYPQYSATTTGSVFDAVAGALSRERWLPELRFIASYHDDPLYLDALAASVREHRNEHGAAERLLFSFHGIPKRYFRAGDPYHCQCHATARTVAARLGLAESEWQVSFQSRVGREPWLAPYTDEVLEGWGREGLQSVQVICPGFSADCLETLEEIAEENRERFLGSGGGRFGYIPALNARDDHIQLLAALVSRATSDWLGWARAELAGEASKPRERAVRAGAMGADV